MIEGALSSNQDRIANHIEQFYMNLYSEQQVQHPFPDVLDFPRISGDNVDWLEKPFEESEVFEVIMEFNGGINLLGLTVFRWLSFKLAGGSLKQTSWLCSTTSMSLASLKKA